MINNNVIMGRNETREEMKYICEENGSNEDNEEILIIMMNNERKKNINEMKWRNNEKPQ